MNLDQLKADAKALARVLKSLGIAELSSAGALDIIAKMKGYRNWQTVQAAGGVGNWNALQKVVYASFPQNELLALKPGEAYEHCGDSLFIALMNVAHSQPMSRCIKTVEHWADEADKLQLQVQDFLANDTPFNMQSLQLPKGLAASFLYFLEMEFKDKGIEGWPEVGLRLEEVRRDLFSVAMGLRNLHDSTQEDTLLLESCGGTGHALPIRIPKGMALAQARQIADEVIYSLTDRSNNADGVLFDFSINELKVKLAQRGLIPLADSFIGPMWDA
jgi:hypothetical protein